MHKNICVLIISIWKTVGFVNFQLQRVIFYLTAPLYIWKWRDELRRKNEQGKIIFEQKYFLNLVQSATQWNHCSKPMCPTYTLTIIVINCIAGGCLWN